MPSQNLINPSPHEFGIFRIQSLCLNDLHHPREGAQEMTTVETRRPQSWHGIVQVVKVDTQLGSVHAEQVSVWLSCCLRHCMAINIRSL